MVTREQIVAEARTWLKTPFRHQGRVRGVGVDCAGVVVGVAHALGLSTFDHTGYGREPHGGMLKRLLDAHLDRVTGEPQPGDVLLMRFEREPQHLAIVSDLGIIHAYERVGRCVEHGLDEVWRRRIVRAYSFLGLA